MDLLRTAVIGVGRLGEAHARVLAGMPGVQLSGVYDVNGKREEEVARRYGTTALGSLSRVAEEADAATVVVPTTAHCEVASFTLSRGMHTFVEKPITATVAEADRLIELSEARGLVLQVGHIERFNGAFRALEGMDISPGFIEAHRLASFDPRGTDVSVVHDLMIHDIDLILRLVGSDLETVDATGGRGDFRPGGHRQRPIAVRRRMRGQRHGKPHLAQEDAQDADLPARSLRFYGLPGGRQ